MAGSLYKQAIKMKKESATSFWKLFLFMNIKSANNLINDTFWVCIAIFEELYFLKSCPFFPALDNSCMINEKSWDLKSKSRTGSNVDPRYQ